MASFRLAGMHNENSMAQTRESGARGAENGYRSADELARILGARRVNPTANEFRLGERRIALKTGSRGFVIPDGLLSRVDAVFYGEKIQGEWSVFELGPTIVRREASPSQRKSHQNGVYHALSKTKCRALGTRIR